MDKRLVKKPLKNLQEIEKDTKEQIPFASYKKQNPAFQKYLEKTPDGKSVGGSFLSDFTDGFKKGFSGVMNVAKEAAPYLPLLLGLGHEKAKRPRAQKLMAIKPEMIEEIKAEIKGGKRKKKVMEEVKVEGCGKKEEVKMEGCAKKKRVLSEKMKKRAELVKKLMKERGLSLAAASKAIKSEGLM